MLCLTLVLQLPLLLCCVCPAGYAKRGLRSAIASAAKGMVVEEVMHAPVTPEQLAGQGPAAAAAAGGGSFGCSQQQQRLMAEMREVDRQWLSRKGKHAGA
jgi:hypothetical protein